MGIHPENEALSNVRNYDPVWMEETEETKRLVRYFFSPEKDINTLKNKLLAEARTETVLFLEAGFNLSMDGIKQVIQALQNNKDTDALCISVVGSSGPYQEKLTSILREVHSGPGYCSDFNSIPFYHIAQCPWRPVRAVAVRKRTFWESGSFFSNKSLKCKYYNELGLLITLNRIACLGYQVQTVEINQDGQVVEAGISHTESLTGVLATELWLSYW